MVIPWLYQGWPPYGETAATTSHSAASRLQSHNSSLGDRGDPVAGSLSQSWRSDPCTMAHCDCGNEWLKA